MIYIAIDFETTGLDCFSNQIIEIGAVKFNDSGGVLDTFQILVKPTCAIESGAQKVHKISKEMLKTAQPIEHIWPVFLTWCGEFDAFVAHNASFEAGFITCLYNNGLPDFKFIDTLRMARGRLTGLNSYKLVDLMPDLKDAHRALPDAIATKDLLLKLTLTYKAKKVPKTQLTPIKELNPIYQNEVTDKQLGYIKSLGGNPSKVNSKQEASTYIDKLLKNNKSHHNLPNKKNRNIFVTTIQFIFLCLFSYWVFK